MKKALFASIIFLLLVTLNACIKAQCVPSSNITLPGIYPISDSIPCMVQGQPYNTAITFMCYDSMRMVGGTTNVLPDSFLIVGIENLPCGITWTANNDTGNQGYANGGIGCIQLSGVPNDSIGAYTISLIVQDFRLATIGWYSTTVYQTQLRLTNGTGCPSVGLLPTAISSCSPPSQPIPNPISQFSVFVEGDTLLCIGSSSQLNTSVSGINGYNNYEWFPVNGLSCVTCANPVASPPTTTTYYVVVNNDTAQITIKVTDHLNINATATSIDNTCLFNNGSADASVNMLIPVSTPPYSFLWSTGDTATSLSNLAPGGYSVTINDANGCSATATVAVSNPCGEVWPGDANADGVVNALDVLHIARANGVTGPVRNNATTNWLGQIAPSWPSQIDGVNDKFADCDGNGIIDINDTTAIALNYSLTHAKTTNQASSNKPMLKLVAVGQNIASGNEIHLQIQLGSPTETIDSLYGIAFSISIDSTIYDNVQLNANNSWLGNSLITFSKKLSDHIDIVIARNNQHDTAGHGSIGELVLTINNNSLRQILVEPTLIKGITANGSDRLFNTQKSVINIDNATTGFRNIVRSEISIYPNPNNGRFILTIDQPTQQPKIELLNIQGQILYTEQLKDQSSLKKELDFADLAKGIYLLKVSTENGVAVKRVVVE